MERLVQKRRRTKKADHGSRLNGELLSFNLYSQTCETKIPILSIFEIGASNVQTNAERDNNLEPYSVTEVHQTLKDVTSV